LADCFLSRRAENDPKQPFAEDNFGHAKIWSYRVDQNQILAVRESGAPNGAQILATGMNGFYESISTASRLKSGDK
jgi:hypothetical protein